MTPVVTVGLDGTPESLFAVRWAAREAELRHATLRLLHAWVLLSVGPEESTRTEIRESDQNYWAERIMAEALRTVTEHRPDLPVVEDLVAQDPVSALLTAAGESEVLVLGSRDMAPLASYFLGDIALHVVARADGPSVLVRAREEVTAVTDDRDVVEGRDVVMGLSLHGPCDALIEFAFDSAARRGVTLRAVHGRNLPPPAFTHGGADDPYRSGTVAGRAAEDARRELAEALRPWREKFPDVRVVDTVWSESAARAVVRGAAGAGLLVVGRRRKRPPLSPRVGHVLSAAVHHAPCPVAVVPHD
ncbi:universal stress protein [Streptomyces odonnellii]|uniref:universal stress protein n=1 Tax=Streptomyces odonnellii TaxID=1417980 RepID=UPI0006259A98|nr:universal stress protein [Streptomyces odonnellii]